MLPPPECKTPLASPRNLEKSYKAKRPPLPAALGFHLATVRSYNNTENVELQLVPTLLTVAAWTSHQNSATEYLEWVYDGLSIPGLRDPHLPPSQPLLTSGKRDLFNDTVVHFATEMIH